LKKNKNIILWRVDLSVDIKSLNLVLDIFPLSQSACGEQEIAAQSLNHSDVCITFKICFFASFEFYFADLVDKFTIDKCTKNGQNLKNGDKK